MPSENKSKDIFNFFTRIAISGLLLWFIFSKINMEKTWAVIKSADLFFLLLGLGLFFVDSFVILVRWIVFIRALSISASLMNIVRYFFIGLFGNLFLPSAIGGDLLKILGLCRGSSEKPKVVASVLLDRLSGFGGLSLVALVVFLFGYRYIQDQSVLAIIGLMLVGVVAVVVVLFNTTIYTFCCQVFGWIPKFKQVLIKMHEEVALLKNHPVAGIKAIGLSCLAQIIFAILWYTVALSLHTKIPLIYFFIFVPIICVASAVPSIGGLGVREAGTAFLFTKAGMPAEVAVGISLINYLYMVFAGLLGGLVYVITLSSGRIQHPSSDGPKAVDGH